MLRVKVVAWFVKSIHVCFLEGRMTFFPYKIHRRAGEMAQGLRYSEVMVGCLAGGSGISCVKEAEKKTNLWLGSKEPTEKLTAMVQPEGPRAPLWPVKQGLCPPIQ